MFERNRNATAYDRWKTQVKLLDREGIIQDAAELDPPGRLVAAHDQEPGRARRS